MRLHSFIALATLLFLGSRTASACDCDDRPPSLALQRSLRVFEGTVTEVAAEVRFARSTHFQGVRVLRGAASGRELDLRNGSSGCSPGQLTVGTRYLVYQTVEGAIAACDRVREAAGAAGEIAWLSGAGAASSASPPPDAGSAERPAAPSTSAVPEGEPAPRMSPAPHGGGCAACSTATGSSRGTFALPWLLAAAGVCIRRRARRGQRNACRATSCSRAG